LTIFYSPAPRPEDETERQRAVDHSGFLKAAGDPALADIVREAAALFNTPMAAISIVDHDRQWFPAEIGLDATETPRAASFCAHAMLAGRRAMSVADAAEDSRFAGNPLVLSGPQIRFYTGMPLIADDGQPLGALCVLDHVIGAAPTEAQIDALGMLARRAIDRAAALR
jgi:GAF domain-containing protein